MAGFRLWEGIGIDDLLDDLMQMVLIEVALQYGRPSAEFKHRVEHALKQVLSADMYAAPACGIASICRPSEEGRVQPWSRKSYEWGLVKQPDTDLDAPERSDSVT